MDKLLTKIVDNLQLTIKNIHIRFENNGVIGGNQFTLGFTLK